jgi:hypothetical protein
MTRKKPWRWSMRFLPCKADAVDPGAGPPVCSATAAMMQHPSGAACAHVTFCRCWRCAAPKTAAAWGGGAGCRADVRMAESIPPSTRPLRQTGRHPRGVPLAWVRADLLAAVAQDVEDRLSGCTPSPRPPPSRRFPWRNRSRAATRAPSGGETLGTGRRYAVCQQQTQRPAVTA